MKSVQRNKYVIQAVLEDSALDSIYKQNKPPKAYQGKVFGGRCERLGKARCCAVATSLYQRIPGEVESDGNFVSAVFDQFRQLSRNKAYHDELDSSVHQLRFLQGEIRNFITSREEGVITSSMKIGYLFDQRLDTSYFSDDELDDAIADASTMISADPEEK
ncbi:hypothetical protein F442_07068 [Phytophthora nicotianae P10297]|uniref:Uncharacterized protein n=4 Tax=Phytophthora nicotianae TaxID=4792 RepID=W2ZKP4_PHYNI|nr:hypothetical protein L914_15900 [Phytophthora nicotianae]ETO77720.1 hypothetical protein F444_07071 [Phytophthora nicotianae P1976]ETP46749.1 hypothetical protein F442_07068 [Phytophthora nicotianae P10297]KUF77381.1 hypothetical protein AM587_10001938 [Phytophthora nicotianae]